MGDEIKVIYVDIDANGGGNGTSWADAFTSLDVALASANAGSNCELWVAEGFYRPTDDTDRGKSFNLKNGVALYGGFAGTEIIRSKRDISAHKTILTGNIGDLATSYDNSYHVVFSSSGINDTAILDGFTITGGNATENFSPNNYGGGMFNTSGSSPTVKNCTFYDNRAKHLGGGMFNYFNNDTTIINCTFWNNSTDGYGGGMCNNTGTKRIINCTFYDNRAKNAGGGINNDAGVQMVTNCTFYKNSASNGGGGMYNYMNSSTIANCIFWNNSGGEIEGLPPLVLDSCVVKDGYSGRTNIITDDPCLLPLEDNGGPTMTCALGPGSPAIDRGQSSYIMSPMDQRGQPRLQGNGYDIGAYEAEFFNLITVAYGTGIGIISPEAGLHTYSENTKVTLSADADISSTFVGWGGDISGTQNPVTVTMSKDIFVTAEFKLKSAPANNNGGCSVTALLPSIALLLVPVILLGKRR